MSIKEHYLYPLYISYLKSRKISKGVFDLKSLSESAFFEFKFKYESDINFQQEQESQFKSISRENKINQIIFSFLILNLYKKRRIIGSKK